MSTIYSEQAYMRYGHNDEAQAAFMEGADFALSHQWVSVEEELPENDEDVLVALIHGIMRPFMTVAWCSEANNGTRQWYSIDDNLDLDLIRFWMPIPPLPEARKEEEK